MAYTTIDDPTAYFNTLLYTGNGASSRDLTFSANAGNFQADWLWFKQRSQSSRSHNVYDSVRGNSQRIETDNTGAEEEQTGLHKTFNTNGFTIGAGNIVNENNQTFVTWGWKAGGSASSNTDGGITSSVSVNQDAGFSIATWTGTGSTATIGHGLNAVPKVIITKARSDAYDWYTYHASIGNTKAIYLNLTNAESGASANFWNNTTPTSSVWTAGGNVFNNNYTFVTYAFAEKQGYSKFGSYTGNGSADGTFVYLGFKPAFVMIKSSSNSGQSWVIQDNKRDGFNYNNHRLFANSSGAEETTVRMDLLSNGFKCRDNDGNGNGFSYIYMAFAEAPLVGSNGVTAKAR